MLDFQQERTAANVNFLCFSKPVRKNLTQNGSKASKMNFSDPNALHREGNNNLGLLPVSSSGSGGPDLDFSFFEDLDFKPKDSLDPLEDLDFIEDKSMLAVAPSMITLGQPKLSAAERRRNDAVALLKSLSVPDPLLGKTMSFFSFEWPLYMHHTYKLEHDKCFPVIECDNSNHMTIL